MPSLYGSYLCEEPPNQFLSLAKDRLEILHRSVEYFSKREQFRAVERLQYEIAQVHIENKNWGKAIQTLIPLWQTLSWRREGWWNLLEKADWALRECARFMLDGETLIAVEWELLCSCLGARPERCYEFSNCLEGLELSHPSPKAIIQAENVLSCISATFAFCSKEGYVGEALPAQLVISSRAHPDSAPIVLSHIKLAFEGGLKDITIEHDWEEAPEFISSDGMIHLHNISIPKASIHSNESAPSSPVPLHDSQSLLGSSNLSFSHGVTKALSFSNLPRDAGTAEAVSITLCVSEKLFKLEVVVSDEQQLCQESLWVRSAAGLLKKPLGKERSNMVKILPKPPKMRIEIPDLVKTYLTDEIVSLNIQFINEEGEDADVSLEVRLYDQSEMASSLSWAFDGEKFERPKVFAQDGVGHTEDGGLLATSLGKMSSFDTRTRKISLQAHLNAAQYGLEVKACYHLLSDSETPMSKTLSTNLVFVRPFEANYDFFPRVLPGSCPNYFHVDDNNSTTDNNVNEDLKAAGLSQKWLLAAGITSFAAEPMVVEGAELLVLDVQDRAACRIEATVGADSIPALIPPDELQERQFELEVQKIDLEDRRSTVLRLQLEVKWRRESSDNAVTTTIIAVPDLVIPFGEPRVVASAQKGQDDHGLIHLDYMIENPSMHVLTFRLNMEPSDNFAFSGPKDSSLQLIPLSRHSIRYELLPLVRGTWINPHFKVMDVHFRKILKINGTEGMRTDKKGVLIWVDAEG